MKRIIRSENNMWCSVVKTYDKNILITVNTVYIVYIFITYYYNVGTAIQIFLYEIKEYVLHVFESKT